MTATAEFALPSDRVTGGQAALWLTAAAVVIAAHGGAALWAMRAPPVLPAAGAPPAVMIELAPEPAAPMDDASQIEPDLENVEEVLDSTPEPIQEMAPVADAPDLVPPPPPLTAPPALLPEVVLPSPEEARPAARPRNLAEVEPPREVKKPEPAKPEPPKAEKRAASAETPRKAAAVSAPKNSSGGQSGGSPAKWQSRLMAHLERRKRYPSAARARQEEGTVVVRFSIDANGNVLSARLARSSGSAELDEATLALLRRASPVPAPPPGASLDITAPVQYNIR
jgi:protein TonB